MVRDKKFDYRCAIGGLPQFFRHTNKDFPGTPYLKADPERRTMWRGLFDSWGKKVIGLTTKGGIKHTNAKGRELTQEDIEPLLKLKDYVIVSLDYSVERKLDGVKYFDFATSAKDYDDTAALIAECDLVLGVNTTAQHCAAAMGVKTWCLVPTWHQWRYAQPSMPWYRHMRIIYQDNDTWKEVINKVAKQSKWDYGDWLMASGDAKEANERTGKKVKLGDGSRMFTDIQVFSNNPRMALKLDTDVVWVNNYPNSRPYLKGTNKGKLLFNDDYKPKVGEIYFSHKEQKDIDKIQGDYIIVEPNVKKTFIRTHS